MVFSKPESLINGTVSNRTTSPPDGVLEAGKSHQPALAAQRSVTSPVVKQGVLQHNAVEPAPPSLPMEASVRKSAAASIHAFEDQQLAAVSVSSDTLDLTSLERIRSSGSLQLIRDGVEIGRKTVVRLSRPYPTKLMQWSAAV
jgi:septal ring-binding cell division protein DamX